MAAQVQLAAADGHTASAYRTGPENAVTGLVVVHEIFGVNAHIRHVCEALGRETGFAIIAPALFDRVRPGVELGYNRGDIARGRALRNKLTERGIILDLEAACAAHRERRVGVVGYCFGGTVAWLGAIRTERFAAAVCWYGGGIAAIRTEQANCPVQMHFGEADRAIPMSDVALIRKAQPEAEIYTYPRAQHGFGCDERASYSRDDAMLARERTLAFFARHLAVAAS
ncbi:MAG: dienelactone hydrolase family protein [Acetobacteraceae bacterium]